MKALRSLYSLLSWVLILSSVNAFAQEFNKDLPLPTIPPNEVEISMRIGDGSYSEIHLATYNGKFVAARVLKDEKDLETELYGAKIHHYLSQELGPRVPQSFGMTHQYDRTTFIMEYFNKWNAKRVAENHGFSAEDIWNLAAQVCQTIWQIHERKIVHRDIKPANILVDWQNSQFRYALADFGLAFHQGDEGETLAFDPHVGTAHYTTQEVFETRLHATRNSELWQLLQKRDYWAFGASILDMIWLMFKDTDFLGKPRSDHFYKRFLTTPDEIQDFVKMAVITVGEGLSYGQTVWFRDFLECSLNLKPCDFKEICNQSGL